MLDDLWSFVIVELMVLRDGVCQGTSGLSMFYVQVRDGDGNLNNIEVQRLKDKLGTRPVPTAELLLDGTRALRVNCRCCTRLCYLCAVVVC